MDFFYKTIEQPNTAEFKDRGSKFLGFIFPIIDKNDVKARIKELKEEHSKANHHCFAYRIGFDGMQYRASDDGEPSGTAGKPILGQIDSNGLTNLLIVVVRYFGGTLLGVPGLINAYKTTASFALQTAVLVSKEKLVNYKLEFDYTQMNEVQKLIKQSRGTILRNHSGLFSILEVTIPLVEKEHFLQAIDRYYSIKCEAI